MRLLVRATRRVASTRVALAAVVGCLVGVATLAGSMTSSAAAVRGLLAPTAPWEPAGSLNNARQRLGMAYFPGNQRFYALGGVSGGGNRAIPIEEYNSTANTWTNRAMLAVGVSDTGAATVGSYIYVPGGYDGVRARTEMQRYDPVANTVTNMAALPSGNFAHAVATQGTKIYVLGGSPSGVQGTTNLIYDTVANSWTTGAQVPVAVQYPTATSDGTYIYLLGGYPPDRNSVQRYDPATNTWDWRAPIGTARGGPASFYDGSKVWVVGGGWTSYFNTTEMYDPVANTWSAGPTMATGSRTVGAAFGNNLAVKAGGWNGINLAVAERMPVTGPPPCGAITINDVGPATPYPSTCVVSGMSGTISDVNVNIDGLSHTFLDDIDMLLVSPGGQNAIFMSDAGGETDVLSCNLTLDDEAASVLPDTTPPLTCPGSYRPADYEPGEPLPDPAPAPSGKVNLSTFDGGPPNGTWRLFIVDDAGLDVGAITSWSLKIRTREMEVAR
jgi:subtilisin-like proprotein convertase family protein